MPRALSRCSKKEPRGTPGLFRFERKLAGIALAGQSAGHAGAIERKSGTIGLLAYWS
jgi:hypothetical protein